MRVAVGDKLQFVFHHKRRVQVVRVDGDTQEREEAVFGRDNLVVNLSATLAVKVKTVRGGIASDKAYRTDFQVVAVFVVDSQFMCGRAQRGENRVEKDGVSREFELQVGIGIDLAVLLA